MLKKLDHIGIAVKSLDAAVESVEKMFGVTGATLQESGTLQAKVALFTVGEIQIEFLQPLTPASPVAQFIAQRGEGVHHLSFVTDDLPAALARVKQAGGVLLDASPVKGPDPIWTAFLEPQSTFGVLTQLRMYGELAEPVRAGAAGKVVAVRCGVGEVVQPGQVLLELEILKMHALIAAPRAGRIARIAVAVGDEVAVGDPLVEFA